MGLEWRPSRRLVLGCLMSGATVEVVGRGIAAEPTARKTGKERLGEKATDEQRVNDCKVAVDRRTRERPSACPWDVQS